MAHAQSMTRRVTIKDLAAAVGVSPSAVSMALADHPRISAATREQVRSVATALGYVASSAARSLKGRRAGSVALVVPNTARHVFGHAYFMHLLVGVSSIVDELGFTVTISTSPDLEHGVAAYERVLRSGAVDGAIITSAAADDPDLSRMVSSGLPVVLLGSYPNLPGVSRVSIDDRLASRAITEHFLTVHGIRSIGYISGPLAHQSAIDRHAGLTDALAAQPGSDHLLVEGDYSEESGASAIEQLLANAADTGRRLDAVIAANDEMAYGAMARLRGQGQHVPTDILVGGFDDFGLARLVTPSLTTITVPAEDIGARAAAALLKLMDGQQADPPHLVLPTRLTVRESCGCPPKSRSASTPNEEE